MFFAPLRHFGRMSWLYMWLSFSVKGTDFAHTYVYEQYEFFRILLVGIFPAHIAGLR